MKALLRFLLTSSHLADRNLPTTHETLGKRIPLPQAWVSSLHWVYYDLVQPDGLNYFFSSCTSSSSFYPETHSSNQVFLPIKSFWSYRLFSSLHYPSSFLSNKFIVHSFQSCFDLAQSRADQHHGFRQHGVRRCPYGVGICHARTRILRCRHGRGIHQGRRG